jgi:epoxide hydrolase-like predicted phosphatase
MNQGKVVVFDLGGVLVESVGVDVLAARFPQLGTRSVVLERWQKSPSVARFERGMLTPEAFAAAFTREWGLALDKPAFLELFGSWVTGFFAGARELVQGLRSRHRVACLSNTNAIHWARLPGMEQIFDHCFVSYVSGFMKPDREAYTHALTSLGVEPGAVYFFDDLPANVAAAREVGINAFLVRGVAETEAKLRAEGLYSS